MHAWISPLPPPPPSQAMFLEPWKKNTPWRTANYSNIVFNSWMRSNERAIGGTWCVARPQALRLVLRAACTGNWSESKETRGRGEGGGGRRGESRACTEGLCFWVRTQRSDWLVGFDNNKRPLARSKTKMPEVVLNRLSWKSSWSGNRNWLSEVYWISGTWKRLIVQMFVKAKIVCPLKSIVGRSSARSRVAGVEGRINVFLSLTVLPMPCLRCPYSLC